MKKLIRKLILKQYANNESYINYLKEKGANIGENVIFLSPNKKPIDERRIRYFSCGNNVVICDGVKFIIHDYSWENLRKTHNEILPNWGGKISVGNNVFIGVNTIILKDCKIGDNVIIGAGSVVTQSIPDNCVCGGNPCKVICTMDEYYNKRKNNLLNEAVTMYKEIKEQKQEIPSKFDMAWFGYIFTPKGEREELLERLNVIGDNQQEVFELFLNCEPIFKNFKDFIDYAEQSDVQYCFKK